MQRRDWEQALRERGHRVTAPRLAILLALTVAKHPTAESIHEHLRDSQPTVNLSTVYRNLAVLQDAGLVTHAHVGSGAPVYHLAEEADHIHLSCLNCGRVTSVPAATAEQFADRVAADTGFAIEPGHSAVYGWCGDCRGSGAAGPAAGPA